MFLLIFSLFMRLIGVSARSNGGYTHIGNTTQMGTYDWIALQALILVPFEETWWILNDLYEHTLETGFDMFFKPYQIASLDLLWHSDEQLSSRQVWEKVNEILPETISRASIINFLNASVEHGLLDYVETTGKGGYRRLYTAKLTKPEASNYLKEIVKEKLATL